TAESLVRAMAGRDVSSAARSHRPSSTEPTVLSMRAVSVPGRLRDVDLEVRPGEIHGLFGIVGAGRTTLTQAIAGIVASTGELTLRGAPYRPRSVEEANERGIVYSPEDRHRNGLFLGLGQAVNVTLPRLRRIARLGV